MTTQLDLFQTVPLDKLKVSPDNVRTDPGDVQDLAASIAAVGILEPLVVVATDDGFEVVAGSRRLAGARVAGLHDAPVIVRDLNDAQRIEASIVENLQRQELAPLDEARAYRRLVDLGWQQATIAERIAVSPAHVSRRLSLLKLPEPVLAKVQKGALPLEDAYALTQLVEHPKELDAVVKEKAKNDYVPTHRLVDRALRQIQIEAKRRPVIGKLKARGVRVLERTGLDYGKHKHMAGAASDGFGGTYTISLPTKEHAKAFPACHAAYVDEAGKIHYVCTNPATHSKSDAKAKGAKKTPVGPTKKQLQLKEAAQARRTAIAAWLKRAPSKDDRLAVLQGFVLDAPDMEEIACELVGVAVAEGKGNSYTAARTAFGAFAAEDPARAAVAVALAMFEDGAEWSGPSEAYAAILKQLGIEAVAKVAKTDA